MDSIDMYHYGKILFFIMSLNYNFNDHKIYEPITIVARQKN